MTKNSYKVDICIIGAGPVGIFASFYAGMMGMTTLVVDALSEIGGQCSLLYPQKPIFDIAGFPEINAEDLIENLLKQASRFNPIYLLNRKIASFKMIDHNSHSYNNHGHNFSLTTSKEDIIQSKTLLIAAGAGCFMPNKPPLDHIEDLEGKSVFYSVFDKMKFKNKNIVIAGGGDSALDWAIELSKIASNIYLIHRRDKFRALDSSVKKIKKLNAESCNFHLITNYQLSNLNIENDLLKEVLITNVKNNQEVITIKADILLPFFGLKPDLDKITDFGLNLNKNNIEISLPHYTTNIKNIYAVGDICSYEGKLKLITVGFAEACNAVNHAYSQITNKPIDFSYSTSNSKFH